MNGAKLNASIVALEGLSARTETGEVRINSSKLRDTVTVNGTVKYIMFTF